MEEGVRGGFYTRGQQPTKRPCGTTKIHTEKTSGLSPGAIEVRGKRSRGDKRSGLTVCSG
jgi:hypothetical protein